MAEEQVTIDGDTRPLPEPFFVIATQNPVEQEGTFELPEAQKDRFVIKTQLGYPDLEGEREIINRRARRTTQTPTVEQVVSEEDIARLQQAPETVRVDQDIRQYISDIVRATRGDGRVKAGVAPRGTQRLFEAARAMATVNGRDHAIPDDVKRIASPVLAHRLVLTADARVNNIQKTEVIGDILGSTAAPAGGRGTTRAGSGTGVPTGERVRAGGSWARTESGWRSPQSSGNRGSSRWARRSNRRRTRQGQSLESRHSGQILPNEHGGLSAAEGGGATPE